MAPPPPHIAVVAFPFSSHAAVLLSFARALAAAAPPGTSLSFLTTANNAAQLRKAGALPGNLRFVEVPDGVPSGETAWLSPPRRMEFFMAAAEAGGVRDGLEAARASAGGARVSCVVGDAFVWMAAGAAASAGAPWVAVWTAASCALLAHLRTDALRQDVGDQAASRADELLTAHAGLGGYRVRDLPDGLVSGDFNYVISLLLHRLAQRLPKAATAVALNTFPGLDPPQLSAALAAELPNCLPLGPYHLLPGAEPKTGTDEAPADPHGCLAWLDRRPARSVAYVSFGTIATPRPDELQELAAGLEASGVPFLWSLREESWPLLPPGFLERAPGLVVPWAPQVGVLRHAAVGAFVTHAGWASVLEGVSSGVPMACRPFFGDQTMNARSVASVWGFGTAFDGPMTRGGVANAVATLLCGEEGERQSPAHKQGTGQTAREIEMKVEVVDTTLVTPSEPTPRHTLWLSNLDLAVPKTHTPLVYYYPAPTPSPAGDGGEEEGFFAPERLREALARALVPFYPLAGRMAAGPDGRLEIDCNGEGALFVVARADFTGDEMFRDFEPSPEARRLLVPFAASGDPPCLLAMVQVTFLKCGGVAVGTGMHHVTMDGAGAIQFIRTWTTLARGLDAASVYPSPPVHDRTVLRARSPPHVTFEHPVYSPSNLNGLPRPFVTRVYTVPPKLLADIKSSCAPGVSTYCALTAHLWRAMCVARGLAPDAESRLRVPANIRQRLRPQLPANYFGNAIVRDLVTVRVGDVLSQPLGFVAERIKRAVARVDDAFVRSVIDYLELESEKGSQAARGQFMPETDLWVVSWLGMPIHDADFRWGCPKFVAPAQMFGSGTAYVTQAPDKDDGVSVLFALEPEYLQCFEKAFYGE